MSIASIISGAAAKASGGEFVQGALSAMVVWLYNDFWDGIAERVAFGDRGKFQIPFWLKKLFTNLKNTNKDRKLGIIGIVQAGDESVSMVEAKLETSNKNLLGAGISGSIGKVKASMFSANKKLKSLTIINAGFNTFTGELSGRVGHLKLGLVGYVGGISGKLQVGKNGGIGLSFGIGGGIKWSWVEYGE